MDIECFEFKENLKMVARTGLGAKANSILLNSIQTRTNETMIKTPLSDDALYHLASTDTWFMGGNFKVSPTIFTQDVIRAKLD